MGNACTSESGAAQQADPLLAALAQKDVEAKETARAEAERERTAAEQARAATELAAAKAATEREQDKAERATAEKDAAPITEEEFCSARTLLR